MEGKGSYQKHPPACFALGSTANVTWSLLRDGDPDKGVMITYGSGEPCMSKKVSGKRERVQDENRGKWEEKETR